MDCKKRILCLAFITIFWAKAGFAQKETVKLVKNANEKKVDIYFNNQLFTSFLYPDSIEKPVLYPLFANEKIEVTRGFPLKPKPGEPTDHPHHMGIWFNFENVNGLDFWNNSYAIPAEKKNLYGWIKTNQSIFTKDGPSGILKYSAEWKNQRNETLLTENTAFTFFSDNGRIIDRVTTLTAKTDITFADAKDGMLAIRLAHELQIPTTKDQKFTDDKGNVTTVKGGTDLTANGNYLTSNGKTGDAAWSTRAVWCKAYGKIGKDSVTVAIIDHPTNINYPTFWHARGYGLFAANPLGEKIFTNGASAKNLKLAKGESITFKYRMLVKAGVRTLTPKELAATAENFAKK